MLKQKKGERRCGEFPQRREVERSREKAVKNRSFLCLHFFQKFIFSTVPRLLKVEKVEHKKRVRSGYEAVENTPFVHSSKPRESPEKMPLCIVISALKNPSKNAIEPRVNPEKTPILRGCDFCPKTTP